MVSAGALVQAQPAIKSRVVFTKSLSIGGRIPPEKLGSPSQSMVPRTHPGRVPSLPTRVRPLLSFSGERPPLTHLIGGPGGSGIDLILGYGPLLSNLTGGYYDIVSWDPRGVGYTTWVFTLLHRLPPLYLPLIQSWCDQLFQLFG